MGLQRFLAIYWIFGDCLTLCEAQRDDAGAELDRGEKLDDEEEQGNGLGSEDRLYVLRHLAIFGDQV